ncbi:MAG: response regulator [Bacteroidota bacterium]
MKTVLLIEDNTNIRENLHEMLELEGYKVVVAKNGRIGLEAAKTCHPDIILCDISMPELNGYEVFSGLKENQETSHIPFIFVTASADRREVELGLNMGAHAYIQKPFNDEELFETIERCILK